MRSRVVRQNGPQIALLLLIHRFTIPAGLARLSKQNGPPRLWFLL